MNVYVSCLPCPRQLSRYSSPTCCQLMLRCHLNLTVSVSQHSMWWHGQCLWCACSPFTTSSSKTIAVVKFRRIDVYMRRHVSEKWETNGWWPSAAATCCKTARKTTILTAAFLQLMRRAVASRASVTPRWYRFTVRHIALYTLKTTREILNIQLEHCAN